MSNLTAFQIRLACGLASASVWVAAIKAVWGYF